MEILIFIIIIGLVFYQSNRKNATKKTTLSSDGHKVPKAEDPTCAKYGHDHGDLGQRYIVHQEVDEGYMRLNGVRVKIKDADKLQF